MGFAIHWPWVEGGYPSLSAFSPSTQLFNSRLVYRYIVDTHAPATYPGCHYKHNFLAILCSISEHASQLLFLAAFHQRHLSMAAKLYENLAYVHTRRTAIALNCSFKNIRNDIRQIIILYEKSRFNSLVWGSLTLAKL